MEESTMHDKLWFKPNTPLQKVKWPQNLRSHVSKQPFLCRCHISYINSPELNHCGISWRNMNAQYWYFTKCVNKSQYICSNLVNSMSLWPQCTALLQRQDFYFQENMHVRHRWIIGMYLLYSSFQWNDYTTQYNFWQKILLQSKAPCTWQIGTTDPKG